MTQQNQQNHIICKIYKSNPERTISDTLHPLTNPRNFTNNSSDDKGEPWLSTTPTKNKSNLLQGMQTKLSLQLCRNWQRDWSPSCGAPTTGHPGFPCILEYPQQNTVLYSILLFSFNKETLLQLQVWLHTKLHSSFVTLSVENGLELGQCLHDEEKDEGEPLQWVCHCPHFI